MSRSRVGAFFDDRALRYDSDYEAPTTAGHALRMRLAAVLDLAGSGPGEILDAGMGPGRLCAELERRDWTVSGVDISAEMVVLARDRLPHVRDRLVQARIEALPFPDSSFDAVIATGSLEYVLDLPACLRELARVLRPGARAILSFPNAHALYAIWYGRVYFPTVKIVKQLFGLSKPTRPEGWGGPFARDRFEAMLRAAGLRVEEVRSTSYLPLLAPLDQLMPMTAARLAGKFEDRSPRGNRRLATQLVFSARKPAGYGTLGQPAASLETSLAG